MRHAIIFTIFLFSLAAFSGADIAQARGEMAQVFAEGAQEAYFVPPEFIRMENAPHMTNPQAARVQVALADNLLLQLEQYIEQIAALKDDVERARFRVARAEHIQEVAEDLRTRLRSAFVQFGRAPDLEGTPLLENNRLPKDGSRLEEEVVTAGHCVRSECYNCITRSCWANEAVVAMSCGCKCSDNCFYAYMLTCGTYAVPVGVTWAGLSVAQALAITASLPGFCRWVPKETRTVAHMDLVCEARLEAFIGQMKIYRRLLDNEMVIP